MNKVYKVIWHATLGAWVAVSEITKGKSKAKKSSKIGNNLIIVAGLIISPHIFAEVGTGFGSSTSANSTAISACSNTDDATTAANYAIALGCNAEVGSGANNAVAIGRNASVSVNPNGNQRAGGIAIGSGAIVKHEDVTWTDGTNSKVMTPGGDTASIAIGVNAQSHYNKETIVGTNAGLNATRYITGSQADITNYGSDSVMFGQDAGKNSQYLYATFIGDEAGRNSIGQHNSYVGQNAARWRTGSSNTALGSNALVGISNSENSTGSSNTAIGTAAGGKLEGNSNSLLGTFAGYGLQGNYNTSSGQSAGSNLQGSYNVASGLYAGVSAIGDDNIFIGRQAGMGVSTNSSVAIGAFSKASKDNAVALGSNSNTNSDATTETNATLNGLTYGDFAGQVTDTGMQVSVGSTGAERQIKNVGAGAISETSTDAINGSQLYATNAVLGNIGNSVTNIFGGNAVLNQNGSINYTNIGGTGKNTIDEAIQAARTTVSQGNNIIVNATQDIDGHINYEVATSPDLTADSLTINNGGPVINQTGIDMNNNKIINVAAGTADTDAVNVGQLNEVKETASKGWNLTTNGNTASSSNVKAGDTVDFIGDGNVVINNTGNNISVGLADTITVGSGSNAITVDGENGKVSVGDTNITSDGLTIVGGPSITKNGIDAGNQTVINVGSGLKDAMGNTTDLNNAVESNGVNVGDIKQVVNSLNTNISAAKTEVAAGKNMTVSSSTGADGQTIYTVATDSKVDFDQITVGSVNIDKSNVDTDGNTKISGVGKGDLNANSTDAVNGSQLYETNLQVNENANNIAANTSQITQNTTAINKGLNFSADSGNVVNRQLGDTVAITGDGNIKTETTNNGVKVSLADDLKVNSISSKDVTVNENLTVNNGANIDMGNNVIHNVASGTADTDAVNVGQLNSSITTVNNKIDYLNHRLDDVDSNARAGIAQAIATAGLPQAYIPGKSMMAISGGTYRGESGYAIGLSSISDNGKWVFKVSGSGNSQGDFGGSVGAGIQW